MLYTPPAFLFCEAVAGSLAPEGNGEAEHEHVLGLRLAVSATSESIQRDVACLLNLYEKKKPASIIPLQALQAVGVSVTESHAEAVSASVTVP